MKWISFYSFAMHKFKNKLIKKCEWENNEELSLLKEEEKKEEEKKEEERLDVFQFFIVIRMITLSTSRTINGTRDNPTKEQRACI